MAESTATASTVSLDMIQQLGVTIPLEKAEEEFWRI